MSDRSVEEIFHDHLNLRLEGDVEGDIRRNFDSNVRLLTCDGVFSGHDGVRQSASLLQQRVGDAVFDYTKRYVHGEMAYLEWAAQIDGRHVTYGADSFLIRDQKIQVQTIYYHPVSASK